MTMRSESTLSVAQSPAVRRKTALEAVFSEWRGRPMDVRAALAQYPELAAEKSAVIELAYVAFRRRCQAGEPLDYQQYCQEFPEIESSLRQILEVDQFLTSNAELDVDIDPLDWPMPEERIGGFEIEREIGRGAFSRVYLARELAVGSRLVALKVTPIDVGEANMLGRLQHPHIIPIQSVVADAASGFFLICMPYCGEVTLADRLQQSAKAKSGVTNITDEALSASPQGVSSQPLLPGIWRKEADEFTAVVQIGAALADALQHAHDHGILHLDLKPSNVLVASDGRPLLLDFNLSQDASTMRRRIGGTLPYMAPEVLQKLGKSAEFAGDLDGRADVFGLGVLLYQLSTQRLPFPVDRLDLSFPELAELQAERITAGMPPRSSTDRQIDRRLRPIIEQCLSVAPAERPASAGAVAHQLRRCLALDARIERIVRRNPRRSLATAAVLTTSLLVGILYLALRPAEYQRQFEQGVLALKSQDATAALEHFNRALVANPTHVESLLGRAEAFHQVGDHLRAWESADQANRIQPSLEGLAATCYLACRFNRFTTAVEAGEEYLRRFPPDDAVLNNLGYALLKSGRAADAAAILTRACEGNEAPLAAFFNRASLDLQHMQKGRSPGAVRGIADLRRVLVVNPQNGEPYFHLAYLLSQTSPRTPELTAEIRELLRTSAAYGTSPTLILSLGPTVPEISRAELQAICDAPVVSQNFRYERLASPF